MVNVTASAATQNPYHNALLHGGVAQLHIEKARACVRVCVCVCANDSLCNSTHTHSAHTMPKHHASHSSPNINHQQPLHPVAAAAVHPPTLPLLCPCRLPLLPLLLLPALSSSSSSSAAAKAKALWCEELLQLLQWLLHHLRLWGDDGQVVSLGKVTRTGLVLWVRMW